MSDLDLAKLSGAEWRVRGTLTLLTVDQLLDIAERTPDGDVLLDAIRDEFNRRGVAP